MNPRIRSHFSIVCHSPDDVELRYGVWNPSSITLRDDSGSGTLARLVLSLTGTSSLNEITAREKVSMREVEELVERLSDLGALEIGTPNNLEFVLGRIPGARRSDLERVERLKPMALIGNVELCAQIASLVRGTLPNLVVESPAGGPDQHVTSRDDFTDELKFQAVVERYKDWRGHFVLVAQHVVDPHLLHQINRVCLELRTPWLYTAIDGPFLLVGPLTLPFRSSCFDCFEMRLMMNLRESASYQRYKNATVERRVKPGIVPTEPVILNMLAAHTAVEAINYLLTGDSCCVNKVLSIYLPTMEFTYHEILRLPNCRSCSLKPPSLRRELYFDLAQALNPAAGRARK